MQPHSPVIRPISGQRRKPFQGEPTRPEVGRSRARFRSSSARRFSAARASAAASRTCSLTRTSTCFASSACAACPARDLAGQVGSGPRQLLERRGLCGELALLGRLELRESCLRRLELRQLPTQPLLVDGGLLPDQVRLRSGRLDGVAKGRERLPVDLDALGERPVLLAHLELVGRLLEHVREGPSREEHLQERGPIGRVRRPEPRGETGLTILRARSPSGSRGGSGRRAGRRAHRAPR